VCIKTQIFPTIIIVILVSSNRLLWLDWADKYL